MSRSPYTAAAATRKPIGVQAHTIASAAPLPRGFALAIELGADAIETDAHITRDGHVVLSHDPTGERAAGIARAIKDVTLAEVRTWDLGARFVPRRAGAFRSNQAFRMPTLDEALASFPEIVFNVDAKQTAPDLATAAKWGSRARSWRASCSFHGVFCAFCEHRATLRRFHVAPTACRSTARARSIVSTRWGYVWTSGRSTIARKLAVSSRWALME
jgi:glycerophosphoryl diester phosphodiesterase